MTLTQSGYSLFSKERLNISHVVNSLIFGMIHTVLRDLRKVNCRDQDCRYFDIDLIFVLPFVLSLSQQQEITTNKELCVHKNL